MVYLKISKERLTNKSYHNKSIELDDSINDFVKKETIHFQMGRTSGTVKYIIKDTHRNKARNFECPTHSCLCCFSSFSCSTLYTKCPTEKR